MPPLAIAAILMIASGSIHAIVNAIVKGGRDKMAGRALTDGSSAIILLPATLFVPWPTGAWGWLAASAVLHAFYLFALIRAYQVSDLSAVYPLLRRTAPPIGRPSCRERGCQSVESSVVAELLKKKK